MFRREWPHFYAFDLLSVDGDDVRGLPLLERKRRLLQILPAVESRLLYLDHLAERGCDLFRLACERATSVLLLGLGLGGQAQDPQQQSPAKRSMGMSAHCQAMLADLEKMAAEMKVADQRLNELVAAMNSATGQARIDAIAAAVTELVAQRRAMLDRMMHAHQAMMSHTMEHMQDAPQSMAMCPMMRMGMRQ